MTIFIPASNKKRTRKSVIAFPSPFLIYLSKHV